VKVAEEGHVGAVLVRATWRCYSTTATGISGISSEGGVRRRRKHERRGSKVGNFAHLSKELQVAAKAKNKNIIGR
jgi:hypothetical protein